MIMRVTLAVLLFTAVQKNPDEIDAPQPELPVLEEFRAAGSQIYRPQ